ncbi:MAG: hypothetical protein FJ320_00760 [SAR202 cluster bacterium]|nr:hypothetical protein [SAR202 cluster bacterium]
MDETVLWESIRTQQNKSQAGLSAGRYLTQGVTIKSDAYQYEFKLGWQNGKQQVLEPISLDYKKGGDIVDKANTWAGRLLELSRKSEFEMTAVITSPTPRSNLRDHNRAKQLLSRAPQVRMVVESEEIETVWRTILRDVRD